MPIRGGQSTQSGILYQNSVAAEFLVKMLLQEDDITSIQVEGLQPIGDTILYREKNPSSYIQTKEHSPSGEWTAKKLQKEGFWVSALRQIQIDPKGQIWLVTSSSCRILRELTERARQLQDQKEFGRHINNIQYLRKELHQIAQFLELDPSAITDFLQTIYIKDSYGSTADIVQRVRSRIQAPKGEDAFAVLRDSIAEGARSGQKFSREDLLSILNSYGLLTIRSIEKALVTTNITELSFKCNNLVQNIILNVIREKYVPHLFVTRFVQQEIKDTVLKTPSRMAIRLKEIQSTIREYGQTFTQRHKMLLTPEQIKTLVERYSSLENKVEGLILRLRGNDEVNWHQEIEELASMVSNLNDPAGDKLFDLLLRAINNVVVVVDKAGRGKTNILCHLAIELSKDNPVVFFLGSDLRLDSRISLLARIGESLGFQNPSQISPWLVPLNQCLKKQQRYLVVIVDAVNESQDWGLLKQNLEELVSLTYDHNLRVLISCRDLHWEGYFHNKDDIIDQYTSSTVSLGDFTPQEFSEVFPKYCNHFHIEIEGLSKEATSALHHPLLLRFFCEAY